MLMALMRPQHLKHLKHEFYMCLYQYRPRTVVSPEYGTEVGHGPEGRIDFLIHRKKAVDQRRSWGIELLKDGDRLAEHAYRFKLSPDGAYNGTVLDGITEFMSTYLSLPHAVSSDNCEQVTFFDNNLVEEATFNLMQGVTDWKGNS
ncbi:hypothetical protein BT96DRAFT_988320 [Gymnopus androsaceus JB14]|uniref:Uncharacterized protein n=1 Tax=Gymnopus androsaceus JB14 TaxID=1447944 RepID=A0A6A4IA08_9AGAR|nr:hypothetical protein BT96DRAFT_988320 [Gymnopus androsaceus JB14]